MSQVTTHDIHQLRVQLEERHARIMWHLGMSWRHLTPHKRPPEQPQQARSARFTCAASALLAHQAFYLCGKPFDSSHFDAIADADCASTVDWRFISIKSLASIAPLTLLITAAASWLIFVETTGTTCDAKKRPFGSLRTVRLPSARTGSEE